MKTPLPVALGMVGVLALVSGRPQPVAVPHREPQADRPATPATRSRERSQGSTDEDRREALHRALSKSPDPHDTCIALIDLGDASSVPLLINALDRPGANPGICTWTHCLDALRTITNQDAGDYADDWAAWYAANRQRSQREWILEGFARRLGPVAEPVDARFAAALVRMADPKFRPAYLRTNAIRLMQDQPPGQALEWIASSLRSADPADRRGAVVLLESMPDPSVVPLLRSVRDDDDIDVAQDALRALNAALRKTISTDEPRVVWEVDLTRNVMHTLDLVDEHTAILSIGGGVTEPTRLVGFDLIRRRIDWSYRTGEFVRSAARVDDRLYFVSDDRVLHCITTRGEAVWTRQLVPVPHLGGPAAIRAGQNVLIPDESNLYLVGRSGDLHTIRLDKPFSRDVVAGQAGIFGAIHNGSLLVFDNEGRLQRRVSTGVDVGHLSAAGDTLCIVNFGPENYLQCLSQNTLQELWRVTLPREDGGYVLQQDVQRVFALGQGRALAFRTATGERLWATNEFRSFGLFRSFGQHVLATGRLSQLEWRDADTGEVVVPLAGGDTLGQWEALVYGDQLLIGWDRVEQRRAGLRVMTIPDPVAAHLPR